MVNLMYSRLYDNIHITIYNLNKLILTFCYNIIQNR